MSNETCQLNPASYDNRVDNPGAYNWCIVPDSSYDVILFASLAVLLACLLQGKFATTLLLLCGAALMGVAWAVNLRELGNAIAWWLGIAPWQMFFYVFLPPLLLDASVRIDWFLFKKVMVQVLTLAFLVVAVMCALMVPIMLSLLRLDESGWQWQHAAMFGAMVASTDAVAIISVMKTSGGPRGLRAVLEGESLLNDASGFIFFVVFFQYTIDYARAATAGEVYDAGSVGDVLANVLYLMVRIGGIGFAMGLAAGISTRYLLRAMRHLGASLTQEVALTVAVAYLSFYLASAPGILNASGVVAVAVMGLYGSATHRWGMSPRAGEGAFDGFWDTAVFIVNALVFLYSGVALVNFFIRSVQELQGGGYETHLAELFWMLPVIFAILTVLRFALIVVFRPLFLLTRRDLGWADAAFATLAGLRGSVSLIMAQAVVTESALQQDPTLLLINSQIVFWTAGYVLLTLVLQVPLLGPALHALRLNATPAPQLRRRALVVAALAAHRAQALQALREAEDNVLSGADWGQVERYTDMTRKLHAFTLGPSAPRKKGWLSRAGARLARACCCRRGGDAPPPAPTCGTDAGAAAADSRTAAAHPLARTSAGKLFGRHASALPGAVEVPPFPRAPGGSLAAASTDVRVTVESADEPPAQRESGGLGVRQPSGSLTGDGSDDGGSVDEGGAWEGFLGSWWGAEGRDSLSEEVPFCHRRRSGTLEPPAATGSSPCPAPPAHPTPPIAAGSATTAAADAQAPPPRETVIQLEERSSGPGAERGTNREQSVPPPSAAVLSIAPTPPLPSGAQRPLATRSVGLAPRLADAAGGSTRVPQSLPPAPAQIAPRTSDLARLSPMPRGLARAGGGGARGLATVSAPLAPQRREEAERSLAAASRGLRSSSWGAAGRASTSTDHTGAGVEDDASPEDVAEARASLAAGLKHHCHARRLEGLLSADALRILDNAADVALDDPTKPLAMWQQLDRDAVSSWQARALPAALFALRRAAVALTRPQLGWLGRWAAACLRLLAAPLRAPLNRMLLLSVEVAMEFLMALTSSRVMEWAQEGTAWAVLVSEVESEVAGAWQFLVEREVEAPERYSAVQSYRAAMAVLLQQLQYIQALHSGGMVDETERDAMAAPVEARMRRLEARGPGWRAPGVAEVLSGLPFMRGQPPSTLQLLLLHGSVERLAGGEELPSGSDDVLWVVLAGVLQVTYTPDLGRARAYFVGTGGLLQLYSALTGERLPGRTRAVAQGSALSKGTSLFRVGATALGVIQEGAAKGDDALRRLDLELHRLAGLLLLERLRPQLLRDAASALRALAAHLPALGDAAAGREEGVGGGVQGLRDAWVRRRTRELCDAMRAALGRAELRRLPPGELLGQRACVALLRGGVEVSPSLGGPPALVRRATLAGRHTHNSLIPWVWEVLTAEERGDCAGAMGGLLPRVLLRAGPDGATLLVGPYAGEADVVRRATDGAPAAPPFGRLRL